MSEFGKGFVYCLVLFAKHFDSAFERMEEYKSMGMSETKALSIWINGASDHLYDLIIPKSLPLSLKKKVEKLRGEALDCGHGSKMMREIPVEKYQEWRSLLDEIALGIDKWLEVKAEKAQHG